VSSGTNTKFINQRAPSAKQPTVWRGKALAQVGDIVYLHDHQTHASGKHRMRWCMVVAINGSQARVAPRSSTVRGQVFTARGEMPEFDMDGWFSRWSLPVSMAVVNAARNIGQLPEPARSAALALFARRRRA
jgi:hypothetical protein